jgi:predicted AAA+ superfamily ATPase
MEQRVNGDSHHYFRSLGISRSVIQKYLRLLEQSFIIKIVHFQTNAVLENRAVGTKCG